MLLVRVRFGPSHAVESTGRTNYRALPRARVKATPSSRNYATAAQRINNPLPYASSARSRAFAFVTLMFSCSARSTMALRFCDETEWAISAA